MLKFQYFGHLMRVDPLEKTLMLGKIEGKKEKGWQLRGDTLRPRSGAAAEPKDKDWLNGYKNKTPTYVVYKRPTSKQGTHTD